jgi:membrane protein
VASAVAPPEGVRALREPLAQLSAIPLPGLAFAIGIVLGLWAISAYAACFGRVVNGFYGVEEGRTFWRMRLTMLLLSVPLAAGGAVVGAIVLTTPRVGRAVVRTAQVADPWNTAWQVGKWPLLLGILALMLGGLYRWTPNLRRRNMSPISWGAFIAISGWAVFSTGFALYVTGIGNYHVYGWLNGALVITLWLFLSNLVLVFGASIDTEVVRLRQLREGLEAEVTIQVQQRDLTRHRLLERQRKEAEAAGRAIRLGHDRLSPAQRLAANRAFRAARPLVEVVGTPALGRPVYRGGMAVETGRVDPESTPSEQAIEQDFTIPEDADYSPGAEDTAGSE